MKRALIMAGGTGGHVVPALTLAKALSERGVEVHWLGTPRGIENTLVPKAGYPLHHIKVSGLRGNGAAGWLKAPYKLWAAIAEARKVIQTLKPGIVIGLGGFASGPGGVAAKLVGVPLVIHEQNAIAGLTNKCLARLATRTYAAFPGAFPGKRDVSVVGNPVRDDIERVGRTPREAAFYVGRPLRVAVTGGSLGAKALNEVVPQALGQLAPDVRPEVRHQAGRDKRAVTSEAYAAAGVEADVVEFIDDMAALYAWADLMICRSGALTVSELAAAGMPAILVPFPHAVDDHQAINAGFLADHGAAVMVRQNKLTPEALSEQLTALLVPYTLSTMARNARAQARLDAMACMAQQCMEIGFEQ
ncbi:undecaprenyldiphospho-muramoylpentapeptide beta-N-acetylglucosaminyltransferase [Larsenimonas suaedae]|uniref:UDP-N-acetylglucosamine--N-acetylmuramyl-(pentapeptide) pyrophosphoryl-undecaprenol N-acetylglucosamine transferase n=1 Tax=Larsenimonas suaedae TaxID=1851019 RepID=A0ABU1GUN2_9GAMM|nr:undecaprenyldiphospho-muramoylpentapeptide beta-N-acetylglucosaminyltransferase [Larsenimonas suaedae]MCM2971039.1 undecaprenyldiphospho-muramoylpentapeptide beta-N-acetylglucosaminyltransferase [Larsenimonas suaedae]MDR5895748.1 undecaprenyldiphospho-muramoylpentapeptide beta-N-acetylglucosaminyltransferase [Larsenimonas suaedae]